MVIQRSLGREVQSLVADLDADSQVRRESAAARLALIGPRAVERLVGLVLGPASARARAGALHALEGIGDPRALEPAFRSLGDPDGGVVSAAVDLLRRVLREKESTPAFDRLVALALDPAAGEGARSAALDALDEMPPQVLAPLRARLANDPHARIRERAQGEGGRPDAVVELDAVVAGGLPDDAPLVRDLLREAAARAPLPTLHRLVTLIREREAPEQPLDRRTAWTATRAAVHLALAERDSRVALYDLRETVERAVAPLPADFLAALARVGDATCLEAVATAYTAAPPANDAWKRQLSAAFLAIVEREKLTRRHQALKRVLARSPLLAAGLPPR